MDDEPKHLRRLERVFSRSPVFFITATTAFRNPVLANPEFHAICKEVWERSERIQHWSVGPYVIMPDHVHLVLEPPQEADAAKSVRDWKRWTARTLGFRWQRDFFEHRLRKEESFDEKTQYVLENPVRTGLVKDWRDWPYTIVSEW